MREKLRVATVWAVVSIAGLGMARATTTPILVDCNLRSSHWATVFTNEVSLQWDWGANVHHVQLDISGMNQSFTTNFMSVTSNYLWQVEVPAEPSSEDVYDLTLSFYGDATHITQAYTSQLAVVIGAFGAIDVKPESNTPVWQRVSGNVVIPFDAFWAEAAATTAGSAQLEITSDIQSQTKEFPNVAGYYGWKTEHEGWGYGEISLLMTFPGTSGQLMATLVRRARETVILIR